MQIGERITLIRKHLNLNQEDFGSKINVTRSAISNYEKGTRNIMDRVISDICREFNVNEEWLRSGNGEMFVEPDTFSLDEYVKQKGATDFELEIIKSFFNIDPEIREIAISQFKASLMSSIKTSNEITAAREDDKETFEDYKQKELEAYALELEAESKGEILLASGKPRGA